MAKNSRMSKMFGALVLSGGMLVSSVGADAEPVDPTAKQKDKKSSSKPKPAAENTGVKPSEQKPAEQSPKKPEVIKDKRAEIKPLDTTTPTKHCQLEVTLYKYHRNGADVVKTCVDNKKDAEILKIIKEAKAQTCHSPFCGCWLG